MTTVWHTPYFHKLIYLFANSVVWCNNRINLRFFKTLNVNCKYVFYIIIILLHVYVVNINLQTNRLSLYPNTDTYINIVTHTHPCNNMHHTHTHTHTRAITCTTHTHLYKHKHLYKHSHLHIYPCTMCARMHTCKLSCRHTCLHAQHTHTCTNIGIHISYLPKYLTINIHWWCKPSRNTFKFWYDLPSISATLRPRSFVSTSASTRSSICDHTPFLTIHFLQICRCGYILISFDC